LKCRFSQNSNYHAAGEHFISVLFNLLLLIISDCGFTNFWAVYLLLDYSYIVEERMCAGSASYW
jgi:hypothetical protein